MVALISVLIVDVAVVGSLEGSVTSLWVAGEFVVRNLLLVIGGFFGGGLIVVVGDIVMGLSIV